MGDDGTSDIAHPHDLLVGNILSDTELAADLLRNYLPAEWEEKLEWSSLQRESGDTVDSRLSKLIGDLRYSARFKGSGDELDVFVVLEHQSRPDRLMSFRILDYIVARYRQRVPSLKKRKRFPYPLTVVLYHGKKPWKEIPPMRDLVAIPGDMAIDILNFPIHLIDLAAMHGEQLHGHPMVCALLDSLQSASAGVLPDRIREIFARLRGIVKERRVKPWIMALLKYYASVRGETPDSHADFTRALAGLLDKREAGTMATTMLEAIQREGIVKGRMEGRMEGRAEGRAEGQIKTLITVLEARFDEIPATLRKKLLDIQDDKRIETLSRLAVMCPNLKEFQKAL